MFIKLFTVLYPFLRELIIGKYSHDERFKTIKILFIVLTLISFTFNYFMGKALYSISKDKIELSAEIKRLEKDIDQLNTIISTMSASSKSSNNTKQPPSKNLGEIVNEHLKNTK